MKSLILGDTGFIGQNLTKKLEILRWEFETASLQTGLDLRNIDQVKEMLRRDNPDIIFNLASHGGGMQYLRKNQAAVIHDNTLMSLNLYRATSELTPQATIINPLSNCSYPGDKEVLKEKEWLEGAVHESVFPYGNYKRHLYALSQCYNNELGLKSINMIFPGAFGPGDYLDPSRTKALDGMIIRMIEAKQSKAETFRIWGSGNPLREWIFVDDFVNILIKAAEFTESILYPVNIAQNKGYSIRESALVISDVLGFGGEIVFDTNFPDGASVKIMDDTVFKTVFPNFEFCNHDIAIAKTVDYYLKEMKEGL